ncbi:MAG: glycosyl hydrolase family 18 protein, partial [Bacillota bacterium]
GVHRVGRPPRPAPVRAGGPVCLTWEHVTRPGGPDLDSIGPLPGVNVVSPTWLYLKGEDGSLSSGCNASYVRWAHGRGYAVWVLVGNDFDPDLTRQVLQEERARNHLIRQLLFYCRLFALDGINVDFENVYPSEKQLFVRFVEELGRLAHPEGLVVSVDVTVKSPSPTWSGFLDRRALARVADYLAVMTYDEHYAGSARAGSVASLPWVEKGIRDLLEEVPPGKLLLGIPFYTRLWKVERQPGGGYRLTSRALGMAEVEALLAERGVVPRFDPATGQDHARWEEDGVAYQVWLENERSVLARVRLAARYRLAGLATWRRGFEKPGVWDVIASQLDSLR